MLALHPAAPKIVAVAAQPAATPLAAAPKGPQPASVSYTVQPGDTLWSIAQRVYHDGDFTRIFDANRGKITSPGLIFPGQVLSIPAPLAPVPAQAAPSPAPAPLPAAQVIGPGGTWSIFDQQNGNALAVGYAIAFLKTVGAPVNDGTATVVFDWMKSEGGGGANNPLNGGNFDNMATSGTQFGGGANNYASLGSNVQAMAGILEHDGYNYPAILAALRDNDPLAAVHDIWESPWASSHYGFGSLWSTVALPVSLQAGASYAAAILAQN
jgi:LysM domain